MTMSPDAPTTTDDLSKRKKRWTPLGALGLLAFTAALLYLSIPVILWSPLYSEIVFHPTPASANPADYQHIDELVGVKHEEVTFDDGHGGKVDAFYWRATGGAHKLIIFHHGNAGNVGTRGGMDAALVRLGADVLAYDYSGYGKSTGTPSLQTVLDDGMHAFDFAVHQLHYQPQQIINYGESLGGGIASTVTEAHPCGSLILQSGVSSLPRVARGIMPMLSPYPDLFFPFPYLDSVAAVRNIHCPVTIIHGGKDTTIAIRHAKLVFANANQPKKFVTLADSNHNSVMSAADFKAFNEAVKAAIVAPDLTGS